MDLTRTVPLGDGTASSGIVELHRHHVVVTAGPDRGLDIEKEGVRLVIGTAKTADVVLSDPTVSRHHAELAVDASGIWVRDLGSRNGTRVHGVVVREALIGRGQVLSLGASNIEVRGADPVVPPVLGTRRTFGSLVARAPSMQRLFDLLSRVASTPLTTLVLGETGTGKELVARSLHEESTRRAGPFVVVDCGALSASLIESDLFGHERGAFTGAEKRRVGSFERANGGTIFLDEIGELPLPLQPKLLRVLERREVRRVGGDAHLDVDVRVVAATHQDLAALVLAGKFREDLFHRLAEVVVRIPPLRERPEDVAILSEFLLKDDTGAGPKLTAEAADWLERRPWPGNVRELRNLLRRASALAASSSVGLESIHQAMSLGGAATPSTAATVTLPVREAESLAVAREHWLDVLERAYLDRVLLSCGEDLDRAAAHTGLHRKSVQRLWRERGGGTRGRE